MSTVNKSFMPERIGNLKIFISSSFDPNVDFSSTYDLIVDIDGPETNLDKTYEVDQIRCGRFVIFEKTTFDVFEVNFIEILAIQRK